MKPNLIGFVYFSDAPRIYFLKTFYMYSYIHVDSGHLVETYCKNLTFCVWELKVKNIYPYINTIYYSLDPV